jgi:transposase
MEVLRQNVGIDIAKDTLAVAFTVLLEGQIIKHLGTNEFKNTNDGFDALFKWCEHLQVSEDVSYTMEATGVYYESFAYYLYNKGVRIHVLLPNKVKKFAESLNIKSKTDKIDSKILGHMGAERILEEWVLSSKVYRMLRTLSRERQQLISNRTVVKNHVHAETHTGNPVKSVMTRMNNHIKYLNKQIESIEKEMNKVVLKDDFLSKKVSNITTIPGVAFLTAITIIAETNGFNSITSIKQLSSYAGYDVSIKESGKWKGKARISKKGNSHIRKALYMPFLSSIRFTETYSRFYERVNENKVSGLIAGTAIQRKLLGLIYTLWKNDTVFIDNYEMNKVG